MKLYDYVVENSVQGACCCGRCVDAPEDPESEQPSGHTTDVVFFKVSAGPNASKEVFLRLVEAEFPVWLDGQVHSFLEVYADLGDRVVALTAMGLGEVLGVWQVMTPVRLLPFISKELSLEMATLGCFALRVSKDVEDASDGKIKEKGVQSSVR